MNDVRFNGNLDFSFHNAGFVSVRRNRGYTYEYKNGKARYSFIHLQSGEMDYFFEHGKTTVKIKEGDFLFIPKDIPYKAEYLKDNTVVKIIVFDISAKKLPSVFTRPHYEKSPEIAVAFHSISGVNARNAIYLTSKIYEIMYYAEAALHNIPKKYKKLNPALREVKLKYNENKSSAYYADLCKMSQSNFRKLFKEYTGKTFIEYRNALRISVAKEMLDSGEFTVSEAAYIVGFNNMSFFYEMYKRCTQST